MGFLQWQEPNCSFNVAEYDFYEQVENGDLNWILPGMRLLLRAPTYACGVSQTTSGTDVEHGSHRQARQRSSTCLLLRVRRGQSGEGPTQREESGPPGDIPRTGCRAA